MSYDLINETTNASISFENGVEYYAGREDGESWSEGSKSNEINVTNIQPGKYHIVATPIYSSKTQTMTGTLVIHKNKMFFTNYLIIAILAGIFPLIYVYLEYALDRKRWYHSDHSKYTYDEE